MKKLYFECYAGVSGDMTVAALLDLGADEKKLREALASLPVSGFSVKISRVKKSGLDACDFDVVLDEDHENHDHDMNYLHGHEHLYENKHEHENEHEHKHEHEHENEHEHDHTHSHEHAHPHEHRNLADILAIIDNSGITPGAKKLASDIFGILADAEAKAHGVSAEEVHFHEVGAVDSIVDVIAAAVCLDDLGFAEAVISPVSEGRGTVRCQHGIIPVPVPAVVNIFAANRLEMHPVKIEGELVTPTGAAIMAALSKGETLPDKYRILSVGLGAGKRNYPTSGIVRAMLIEADD